MRYTVTKDDADEFEQDVSRILDHEEGDRDLCIKSALQDFIDRIPEPTAASPPEWIKVASRYVNLRHVVDIRRTHWGYEYTLINGDKVEADSRNVDCTVHFTEMFLNGPWLWMWRDKA